MLKYIFSMKVAVLVLFLFGAIIGGATFIENDYGTQTAQALIYNARWFEFFLLYFILLIIYNMVKYKTYKSKPSVFVFHAAFLLIAIGAAITRYVGYEGIMHIREGHTSSSIKSSNKVLNIEVHGGEDVATVEEPIRLSSMTKNSLNHTLEVNGKKVHIDLVNYLPAAEQKVVKDKKHGKDVLELMVSGGGKGKSVFLEEGSSYDAGSFMLTFNYNLDGSETKPVFEVGETPSGALKVRSSFDIKTLSMATREEGKLTRGINDFKSRMLYQFNGNSVVLRKKHEDSVVKFTNSSLKTVSGKPEMLTFDVKVGDQSKRVDLFAYPGSIGEVKYLKVGDVEVGLRVGAKIIPLPFSLTLEDFKLERYPGSMTPSSYASDVILNDSEKGIKDMPYKIFMNHVLDHRNYRFFQSSYDPDEKGTILSVNHDPGTLPTYLGYILLAIGMIWNLFDKNGRFQKLLKGARKLQATAAILLTLFALGGTTELKAAKLPALDANQSKMVHAYNEEVTSKFGHLIIQDSRGRMKPVDTMAHEVIAKLTGKTSIYDVNPTAMILGMTVEPKKYQYLPMIKVDHTRIAKELGLPEGAKYARFYDFFTEDGTYKLAKQMNESVRKKPLEKNLYDKELVKVDERLNVAYMIYTGELLQLYPEPHSENNKWMNPQEAIDKFPKEISDMLRMMTIYLFQGAEEIQKSGNTETYDKAIKLINMYQKKFGSEVMPSKKAIDIEIEYNKLGLLSKLVPLYLFVGLILLFSAFMNIVNPFRAMNTIVTISWVLMIVGFAIHIVSMAMRWYIAGHAPWSNAYESIVFIAAATVIAGLIFARKSPFTLGATALLAGITMGVAHMNFINPEITNLVPVLKSYWLMIHVATIISGDGFLGLGSILSLMVLILYIMKRGENENIDRAIKELTNIAEMSLIVGLFLLTIGNFLGGVWANESWGRYWGWDSKETWAAVTILVYATVLHLRFIPALKGAFAFNVASLWAYSTVIMTYFGVNYYLSGLHSYAAGAPMPLPSWVIPAVIALFALTLLAAKSMKNIKLVFIILSPLILWVAGLLWMLKY
jgi:cytochrome c-type biogenesis protein CcsB